MDFQDLIKIINGEAAIEVDDKGIEYIEDPFFIERECYSNIYNEMVKYIAIENGIQKNFVVYGNSGIGKKSFCAFLCKEFKQTNFQVIFRASINVYLCKGVEDNEYHPFTYLPQRNVINPYEKSIIICNDIPISEDEYCQDDVVILVSGMKLKNYKVMRSKRAPIQFCLLPFNKDEIEFYKKKTRIEIENYGGIPGLVDMNVEEEIKKCQKIDIYSGIPAEYNEYVYIYDVENEMEVPKNLKFISKYIEEMALNKVVIDNNNFNIYYSLLTKKIEGDNDRIGGEGGYHYEHLILYYIKSKYENTIKNKLELDKLNEKALPFLIDCSFQSNFESVDAIEINEKYINGIQVTVSNHHPIKESLAILFNVIFQETYDDRMKSVLKMLEEKKIDKLAETLYYLGYTPSSLIDKELNIYKNQVNQYLLTESELRFGFKLPFLFELVTIPEIDIDDYVDNVIKEITIENMNKIFDKDELEDIINGFGFDDDELKIINYSKDVLEVLKELKENNGKLENTVVDIKLAPSKKNPKTVKNKPNIPKEIEELNNNETKWREYEKIIDRKPFENYKNDNVKVIMKKKIRKLVFDSKDYAYDCSIQNVIEKEKTKVDKCKKRVEIMKQNKDEVIKEIDEEINEIKEMIKKGITDEEKKYFNQTYLDKCYNPRFVISMISHKYDVTMDIEESFDFSKYTDILGSKMSKYIKHIYPSYDTFDNDKKKRIMTNKFKRVEKTNEIISYIELDRKRINDPDINIKKFYYEDDNKKNVILGDNLKITSSLIDILKSNERMKRFLDSNFIYLDESNLLCSSYKEGLDKLDMILSYFISPTAFYTKDGQRRNYYDCEMDNTKPIENPCLLIKLESENEIKIISRDELYYDDFRYDNLYGLILKAKGNRNEVYYITEYLTCPYCFVVKEIKRECEYVNNFTNKKTFYCDKCNLNVSCQPKLDNKCYKAELKYVKDGIDIYYKNKRKESYKYGDDTPPLPLPDDSSSFSSAAAFSPFIFAPTFTPLMCTTSFSSLISADTTMENEDSRKDEDNNNNNNVLIGVTKRKREGIDLKNEKEIKKGKYDNNKHKAFSLNSEMEIEEIDEEGATDNPNKKIKTNNTSSETVATLLQPQPQLQPQPPSSERNSFDYVKRIFDIEKKPPRFIYNEILIEIDDSIKLFQYPSHKILVRDYYPLFWKRIEYNIIYNWFCECRNNEYYLKKLLKYINVNVHPSEDFYIIVEREKEKLKKLIKCKPTKNKVKSYYLLRGQPGCGKSTFLVYFILKFIQLKKKLGINIGLTYYKSSKKEDGTPDNPVIYNLIENYLEEDKYTEDIIICDSYDVPENIFRLSSIIINVSSPDEKNYSNIKDFKNGNKVYFYLDICNDKEINIWKENCLPDKLGNVIDKNLISLYNRVPRHLYFAAIHKAYYKNRNYWDDIYTNCIRTTVNNLSYFGFIKKYLFPCDPDNKTKNLEEDIGLIVNRLDTDMSHYIIQYKVLDYDSIDKVQLEYISKKVFKYLYFCTSHRCSSNGFEIMKDFFFNKIKPKNNHPLYKLLFNELVWYTILYNEKWNEKVIKFNNDQMNILKKLFHNTSTSIGCGEGYYIAPIDIGSDDLCYVVNNVVVFPLYYVETITDVKNAIVSEKRNKYKQYFIEYSKDIQKGLSVKLFTVEDINKLRQNDICCFIRKNIR